MSAVGSVGEWPVRGTISFQMLFLKTKTAIVATKVI